MPISTTMYSGLSYKLSSMQNSYYHLDIRGAKIDALFLMQQPINSWDSLIVVQTSVWSSQ